MSGLGSEMDISHYRNYKEAYGSIKYVDNLNSETNPKIDVIGKNKQLKTPYEKGGIHELNPFRLRDDEKRERGNKQYFIILLLLMLIFSGFISCNHDKKKPEYIYRVKFNNKRNEIGLNKLSDNWVLNSIDKSQILEWYDPRINLERTDSQNDSIIYWAKMTFLEKDTLIREIDIYVNPCNNLERLHCTYNFFSIDGYDTGWSYFIHNSKNDWIYISKEQKDSILELWMTNKNTFY